MGAKSKQKQFESNLRNNAFKVRGMKAWNQLRPSPENLHGEKRQPAVPVGFDQDSHLGNEKFLSLIF